MLTELFSFSQVFALGLGLVGLGVVALIQCGGQKRLQPKKTQAVKHSGSSKSNKPVTSSRSKQVVGLHKPKKASGSSRSKKSSGSKKVSSNRSSSERSAKKSTDAASKALKTAGEKVKSAKRSVQRNVNKALEEVTGRSSKRIQDPSLKDLQETQKTESQKHAQHFEVRRAGQLVELQMEPRELQFNKQGGLLKVQLHNPSSVRLAIKVKTSDNQLYRVNPVYAYIEPGQQLNVYVMRQNGSAKLDKIVFVTVQAAEGKANLKQLFAETPYGHHQMTILPVWA